MTIGYLLKEYRDRSGFSQQKVAGHLNIKRELLSYYETSERDAPLEVLERLANLYGVQLSDFFETDQALVRNNVAFAFRADEIDQADMKHLEVFRKAVNNYFKICALELKNGV